MSSKHRYRHLLHSIKAVDVKCDRILSKLDVMHSDNTDSMLESIKESARDMYLCSLEERRRTDKFLSVVRHD